jgi:DNA-binding transcriptional MerR regulator
METSTQTEMRIGELAGRLGLNPRTIRFYERIGLLPEPDRTPSGYRRYDHADVERLQFIRAAQRLGLTLDEIGEILALRDGGQQPCGYVREVLRREVAAIDHRIRELRALRTELAALDARADELPEPPGAICRLIDHVRLKQTADA